MHEVTLSIESSQSYANVTKGTGGSVELWCKDHCDLLYVTPSIAEPVLEYVEGVAGVQERVSFENHHIIVTEDCLRGHHTSDIDSYLDRHNCMLQPPLRYERGNKICRILAVDSANLTALYRDLVEDFSVSVESKREIRELPELDSKKGGLDDVIDLTERQETILEKAYEQGYYDIPRDTTAEELADEFELGRRTIDEHLRRAEKKVLATFFERRFPARSPDR